VFALVSLQPTIDDQTKTVFLTFNISAGKRAYVRNIYFSDNTRTNDAVLRREVQQMEGAVVSTAKLDQSKHQLSLLPYIRDVQMDIAKVPTADDQVDVNYKVTEESSTQATFGLSYSQLYHFGLNAGLNQKNFLGTGKTVGLNFSGDRYQKYYGVSYSDPYFTQNGVRRSINLALSKFNPHGANISRSYSTNQYSLSDVYDIPIEIGAANTRIQLGYGYEDTQVKLGNEVSNVVQDYVNRHGRHFQQLDLIGGISRDSRDRAIFPTSGVLQSLSFNFYAPLNKRSLKYYTMAYDMHWYQPLVGKFVATARGALAYGNALNGGPRDFPFFKNFYAGGIDSVRGYEGNTLGPRDSNGDPVGGNLLGDAGVGIVFPNFISDNLRTTLFMDGGNVYETYNNRPLGGTASGNLRYSTGIEGDWLTPLGLIDVSIAKALNPKRGDSREFFQFSLGANFG
jgi:outer membrane protein insertion porin family